MNTFGCKDTFFLCNFQEKYEKKCNATILDDCIALSCYVFI